MQWPQLRHDVREYIQSCATCQKMEVRHKSIHPGVAICPVDTKTNAASCVGHYRPHGYLYGFQIDHRRHRHLPGTWIFSPPMTLQQRQRRTRYGDTSAGHPNASQHLHECVIMGRYHTLRRKTTSWRGRTRRLIATSGTYSHIRKSSKIGPKCFV